MRDGLAAMFVMTGTAHFVGLRDTMIAMVPPGLPAPAALVSISGALELLGAVGLLWSRTRPWAGLGLFLLLLAVFPANVHAARAGISTSPGDSLLPRTLIQLVFLAATLAIPVGCWRSRRRASPSRPMAGAGRGAYGVDGEFSRVSAGTQLTIVVLVWLGLVALTVTALARGWIVVAVLAGVVALGLLFAIATYAYTTRVGKFRVWSALLTGLRLDGDEELLDLGCGRGAVLLAAARLLPRGHATGIDRWQADQTGNCADATHRNARSEGVADRVRLFTGDIRRLPFDDHSFDVIVSSLVLHNIPDADGRRAALDEAVRVLRPGGRLLIADLAHTGDYLARLRHHGLTAGRRNLGPRMWWTGPWGPTHLVTATAGADRQSSPEPAPL
ncbi:methyltransferase domain-containing protein [Actinoplanes awajinensis]|nr:methyltransferase domain-containing protein [Actinoplanes awajinensis]